jgi:uncharacterized repeat protein (TIGR03803 family)
MIITVVLLSACGGGSGISAPVYTVGGVTTGLSDAESVTILNNGGNPVTLRSNASFTLQGSQASGGTYAVTVQSRTPGITCSVSNGVGTVGSTNVTNISVSCSAATESVLYSFGTGTDANGPFGGLLMDGAGNFYGTTIWGGASGLGAVFKLTPSGTESVMHSFSGTPDGQNSFSGLISDNAGNLYGTTNNAGANNAGTVFKIAPSGAESVVYSFGNLPDGQFPYTGRLIMDQSGNLYGMTESGGANNNGTVFKITPSGTETILYSFGTGTDGNHPNASLIVDTAGNLYGTTSAGGANNNGTVFKITPSGTETILYSFGTGTDGSYPISSLIMDTLGNLYGTTYTGGTNNLGTVFKVTPSGTESVLHSFGTGTDGNSPVASLIMDTLGNLYGTTSLGGTHNLGTVFKVTPSGTESVLHSFGTGTDGAQPNGELIVDSAGNLYGTTTLGGTNNIGTVFKIGN